MSNDRTNSGYSTSRRNRLIETHNMQNSVSSAHHLQLSNKLRIPGDSYKIGHSTDAFFIPFKYLDEPEFFKSTNFVYYLEISK